MAGSNMLKRLGHKKSPMRYILCSFVFAVSLLFLPFPKSVRRGVIEYGMYLYYALIAGMLPLSLYLNYRRKKSILQPTIDNAS